MNKIYKNKKGFNLVEVILAVGIFVILASGVFSVVTNSYRNYSGKGDKQTVVEFAQEGIEITKAIRDNSWQKIETVSGTGNQGVAQNANGYWEFSGTSNTLGDLTRTIVISDVERNSTWEIVDSGGTVDPNTKKIIVTVSATGMADYVLTTYITNWSYKTWEQSDWSGVGDREFWSSLTMASSSYSNVSTTTVGELVLSQTAAPGAIYGNLTSFATTTQYDLGAWRQMHGYVESPDGDTLYSFGQTNVDIKALDITNIRENIFNALLWENAMPEQVGAMTINPNGRYLYALNYDLDNAEIATIPFVWVIDTSDGSIVDSELSDDYMSGDSLVGKDIILSSDASMLYAISSYGGFYAYEVSADGSTLTAKRDGGGGDDSLVVPSWNQWGTAPNRMWLDDSGATPYMYIVTDYASYALAKWDISSSTVPSLSYAYEGSGDCDDLESLGDNGSGNEFVIVCADSTSEIKTIRDTGSALTVLDTIDPGTFNDTAELEYDGDGEVLVLAKTSGNLAIIDVSDVSNLSQSLTEDSTTIESILSTLPHHFLQYVSSKGGYLFQDYGQAAVADGISWLPRPETRNTGSGYDYKRTITIDSGGTKVISGPHSNFPFLFAETQDYLKTTTNGGNVESDKGYDIIFTSDSAGTTILDHEIEKYSSSTGEFVAWVEVPILSTNKDIYMFYGNSNIENTQERMEGVWNNNDYKYVNHMQKHHELLNKQGDSSAFHNYLTNYNNVAENTSGKIGTAFSYDGDADYGYAVHSDNFGFVDQFTWSFWVNISGVSASTLNGLVSIAGSRFFASEADPSYLRLQIWDDTNTLNSYGPYNNVFNWGEWTKIDVVFDRPVTTVYKNGSYLTEYATDYNLLNTTGGIITGTIQTNAYWMNGLLDEVRLANTAKTAGWVETAYNNENTTSTFYSIGSQALASGYESPGSLYSSILDLGSSDKELKSITVEQNLPTGCALQITAEVSDDSTFASGNVISEVYSDTSVSYYTSSTDATLNGKRYLRYKVDMTACNSNTETPTLYGAKFNYR
ncbi:DUF2341 domain-containing protein [Patescibacteria group bacterium]|nr:DUF2341 domain-containing protein [Patescibacteria group bacterium]